MTRSAGRGPAAGRGPRARGLTLPGVVQAVPDAGLAAAFLLAWTRPDLAAPWAVKDLVLVMLYEFIVVHSAGFMGFAWIGGTGRFPRVVVVAALVGFYTLFVGAFAASFGTWWPLLAFWGLSLNRLLPLLLGQAPKPAQKALVLRGWVAGVIFYLGFVALTVMAPVPDFGAARVAGGTLPDGGLWIDEPYRALAFGFLYFAATALSGAFGHAWIPAPGLDDRVDGS